MNRELGPPTAVVSAVMLSVALLSPVVHAETASPVLKAMETEIQRSLSGLKEKADPPPYFISYLINDEQDNRLVASYGALREDTSTRNRLLDVDVRVGDYKLDNSHRIRGDRFSGINIARPVRVPLEDDVDAIRAALWLETDRRCKAAVEKLIQVKTNRAVKVEEEDKSADFSQEAPERSIGKLVQVVVDRPKWTKRIRDLSRALAARPEILESNVTLTTEANNRFFVNSEGSVIQEGLLHVRLAIYATTKADDGMELYRYEAFDAHSLDGMPDDKVVRATIDRIIADLVALRAAPVIEPYTGPAILSGRAAGVFFHEIFGHRIEGHRQKDEEEGQTFTKKIGELVLPDFVSVYDDPTIEKMNGEDLNGYYLYDDEGVKARRVSVVDKGVLRNFLMSRAPIANFANSNGHGRKSAGRQAVGRQGNLIIDASRAVSEDALRKLLIEECRKQGKPFGLIFREIAGGFTMTGRGGPQAFQVTPIMVYRLYTDGRPEELVRGVDLIGTPLVSFSKILAASDKSEVFNGYCGAESGTVPVSAVAPSILTGEIEIQKKEKGSDRPPLLPAPAVKGGRP